MILRYLLLQTISFSTFPSDYATHCAFRTDLLLRHDVAILDLALLMAFLCEPTTPVATPDSECEASPSLRSSFLHCGERASLHSVCKFHDTHQTPWTVSRCSVPGPQPHFRQGLATSHAQSPSSRYRDRLARNSGALTTPESPRSRHESIRNRLLCLKAALRQFFQASMQDSTDR